MEYLQAIILGAVQGLTEFLPISSSGHLTIFQHLLNINGEGSLALEVFLHIGTLIAVIAVYYKTFLDMIKEMGRFIRDLFTGKLKGQKPTEDRHMLYMFVITCLPLLVIICPIGNDMKVKDVAEALAASNASLLIVGIALLITSVLLFYGTYVSRHRDNIRDRVETKDAIVIGLTQLVSAMLPGLSRSGSTISAGMISGVEKNYMVRYSFVLGTPAVIAATLLEFKGLLDEGTELAIGTGPIIVGIIVAAIVGVLSIKLLERLVKTDKFIVFGYYCAIVGAIATVFGIIELV
ncbi:MAG: undecaprenyl-diphosphate phosphatase [Clostridia bacterium]|nr:undecaprenyl-diphosphate phosphatase [Candidatus Limimonas egerieequi]MCQ2489166.1 undecaprenyl-diphosphate phosphatase [Clostridia bacterium]